MYAIFINLEINDLFLEEEGMIKDNTNLLMITTYLPHKMTEASIK